MGRVRRVLIVRRLPEPSSPRLVVTVNVDACCFHRNTLLGAVLHLMYIETDAETCTSFCNCLPSADETYAGYC